MKRRLFQVFNWTYGIRARFWTIFYRPFFGRFGQGSRLERVVWLTNPHLMFFGDGVAIAQGARIEAFTHHRKHQYDGSIHIGGGTSAQPGLHLSAAAKLVIGENVLMGSHVFITDNDHGFSDPEQHVGEQPLAVKPVCVQDFVWLGENVIVLKGVTIGHHAVVGANSVVTRDLPPFAIAVGAPARVIRTRDQANRDQEAVRHEL